MYKKERKFGAVFTAFSLAVGFRPLIHSEGPEVWWFVTAGVFAAVTWKFPRMFVPLLKVWLRTANIIGWINTRVLLNLVFLFIITPFALGGKLLGHDLLQLKKQSSKTPWKDRDKDWSPASFRKQY